MRHDGDYLAQRARSAQRKSKKTGRKINSPPGLKFGVMTPKDFEVVIKRWALMPLFLRCFFLRCFFSFLGHRLIPPFQSANAVMCELGITSLTTNEVIVTFSLSNIFLACLKFSLRARARYFFWNCAIFFLFRRSERTLRLRFHRFPFPIPGRSHHSPQSCRNF